MFIIWLCRLFRFRNGDRELEVRTATYGPGIDQSQHAKSVSHIIIFVISCFILKTKQLILCGYRKENLHPDQLAGVERVNGT